MDGVWGLVGGKVFLLEAAPTLALGIAAFLWLTDRRTRTLAPPQQNNG